MACGRKEESDRPKGVYKEDFVPCCSCSRVERGVLEEVTPVGSIGT